MKERRRAAGILLWPFRALLWLLRPPLRLLWRAWGRLGLALRAGLTRWLLRPLWRLLSPIVRFWGRVGLALRTLLTLFLWQPLLAPLGRLLRPVGGALRRLLAWLFTHLIRRPALFTVRQVQNAWQASAPRRRRWGRTAGSRWAVFRARMRVRLGRRRAPAEAVVAPPAPTAAHAHRSPARFVATVVTINVAIVAISLIVTQLAAPPFAEEAPAGSPPTRTAITTATTRPSPTPIHTPSATAESIAPVPVQTPRPTWTPWPTPDPLSTGGSVAFTLRRNGQDDIYALSVGRAEPIRLTSHPADDRAPAWSPDGRRLAFASNRDGNWELYVLDLQTGTLRRITDDPAYDMAPAWSPDGQWLTFERYQNENLDIFLVEADGRSAPLRLTEHRAHDFAPSWSPGGRHVAFVSRRSGNQDLYVMSLDAATDSRARNVTNTPERHEDRPVFNGDGSFLAYHADDATTGLVYALPLNEYRPAGVPLLLGQGRDPHWSPRDSEILFVQDSGTDSRLVAASLDAWSVAPQAFATSGKIGAPVWSAMILPADLPPALRQTNQVVDAPLYEEIVALADEGAPYLLREMRVDTSSPFLNDRADEAFRSLRQATIDRAGWDLLAELDGMFAPIDAPALPGQSDRTWHKAGRAFDLRAAEALAFDPRVEVVREDRGDDTFWRIYLRAAVQDGSMGEPLTDRPWDFRARYGPDPRFYDQGGRMREVIPAGYYVDFTRLAADYGWSPVPAASNWRTFYPGIRFWQFEYRQGLTWEQAMLELYTPEEILAVFGE